MNDTDRLSERARLRVEIDEAAKLIPILWPLTQFIAVNPLWDLVDLSFEDAVSEISRWLPVAGYPVGPVERGTGAVCASRDRRGLLEPPLQEVCEGLRHVQRGLNISADQVSRLNRELSNWCALYISGVMEDPEQRGLYASWREYVGQDPSMKRWLGRQGRAMLGEGPPLALDSLGDSLRALDIPTSGWEDALRFGLTALPGWSAYAKWRTRWASPDDASPKLYLADLLAIRYSVQAVLASNLGTPRASYSALQLRDVHSSSELDHRDLSEAGSNATVRSDRWSETNPGDLLRKRELRYQAELVSKLSRLPQAENAQTPIAQVVLCIDVRSEGFRRHLEEVGPFETFGFAGFFALPVRFRRWGSTEPVALCPVIVNPTAEVEERPQDDDLGRANRMIAGQQVLGSTRAAFDGTKNDVISSFLLAEAGGLFAAPMMVIRTAFPRLYGEVRRRVTGLIECPVEIPISLQESDGAMSLEERVLFAESALRSMGLTKNFAPVVILCGHGSTTENNPYASSLDCGACAGNRGGASARAAVAIFNEPSVRAELRKRSIEIPDETVFLAGEHDTALDTVKLYDEREVDPALHSTLERVRRGLEEAGRLLGQERARSFPGYQRSNHTLEARTRSLDWAQVQPEWGLARNACFIVAPRSMTKGADLHNRSFLHSYNPNDDPDGGVLEAILTGPMVVGHWINMQYYFSSVDPQVYSSGDKTLHNVVGGVGVVSGVGGDLRLGLPLQSIEDEHGLYHEPLRLLVVICAPRDRIDAVVGRNPILRRLLDGEWIFLLARDSDDGLWWNRERNGVWKTWSSGNSDGNGECNG